MPREMRECFGNDPTPICMSCGDDGCLKCQPQRYLDPICLECGSQRCQEDIDANGGLCPVCEQPIVTLTIEQVNAILDDEREEALDHRGD